MPDLVNEQLHERGNVGGRLAWAPLRYQCVAEVEIDDVIRSVLPEQSVGLSSVASYALKSVGRDMRILAHLIELSDGGFSYCHALEALVRSCAIVES